VITGQINLLSSLPVNEVIYLGLIRKTRRAIFAVKQTIKLRKPS